MCIGGDMRAAINAAHFRSGGGCELDERLNTFRAVGKLLYAKRGTSTEGTRGHLSFDPEAVIDASGIDPGLLCMFLHDNYPKAVEEEDIDAVADITDCFSCADCFVANPVARRHVAAADDLSECVLPSGMH